MKTLSLSVRPRLLLLATAISLVVFLLLGLPAQAARTGSLVVNTASDVVDPNDNLTSLREAIAYAATLSGAQTITFDPALSGQTCLLGIIPFGSRSARKFDALTGVPACAFTMLMSEPFTAPSPLMSPMRKPARRPTSPRCVPSFAPRDRGHWSAEPGFELMQGQLVVSRPRLGDRGCTGRFHERVAC